MPQMAPKGIFRDFYQQCRERCTGAWNVRGWWILIAQAFTIQTIIHFVCYSLYLLQMNKRLPSMIPPMGMPFSIRLEDYASLGLWVLSPWMIGLFYVLVNAPVLEELRYRVTVWLGIVAFRQPWLHWVIIACSALLWALLHRRAMLGTVEIVTAGFFAGWLVLKTKNILPSIIFHSAWNVAVLLCAIIGLK